MTNETLAKIQRMLLYLEEEHGWKTYVCAEPDDIEYDEVPYVNVLLHRADQTSLLVGARGEPEGTEEHMDANRLLMRAVIQAARRHGLKIIDTEAGIGSITLG